MSTIGGNDCTGGRDVSSSSSSIVDDWSTIGAGNEGGISSIVWTSTSRLWTDDGETNRVGTISDWFTDDDGDGGLFNTGLRIDERWKSTLSFCSLVGLDVFGGWGNN